MLRLRLADRIYATPRTLNYIRFYDDYVASPITDVWSDTGHSGYAYDKLYVVQTNAKVIERCIQMATDPGDLVLDPTCGSGTTAYVAEQWGRRWITIDTSRVALALARTRIMGTRYPYYLLADSPEGQAKLAEVERREPSSAPTYGDIRQGFVYERVPHITLRAIANNAEIDVIWERMQPAVEAAVGDLNEVLQAIHPVRVEGLDEERAWQGATTPPFASPAGGREGELIDFSASDAASRHVALWRNRPGQRPAGMGSPARGTGGLARGRARAAGPVLGGSDSRANVKSTLPLPPRPTSSISTTSRTRTDARCAWPGRSPWTACRRTASWVWTSTAN